MFGEEPPDWGSVQTLPGAQRLWATCRNLARSNRFNLSAKLVRDSAVNTRRGGIGFQPESSTSVRTAPP